MKILNDLLSNLKLASSMLTHYKIKRNHVNTINKYDYNLHFKKRNDRHNLWANGYYIFETKHLFNSFDYTKITRNKCNFSHNEYGNYITRDIDFDIWKSILSSTELNEIVHDYLGDDARLDDCYIWSKTDSKNFDISEGWHTDDVGNRLKLFICIEAENDAPSTLYCPETNRYSYNIKFKHLLRYFSIINNKRDNYIDYIHTIGKSIIFDTNGEHRGSYQKKTGNRLLLVLEFINKYKSNAISGECPCGPGQSPSGKIIFPNLLGSILSDCSIIDKQLLMLNTLNNTYTYSINNVKSNFISK